MKKEEWTGNSFNYEISLKKSWLLVELKLDVLMLLTRWPFPLLTIIPVTRFDEDGATLVAIVCVVVLFEVVDVEFDVAFDEEDDM